jgi:hypothetical protein
MIILKCFVDRSFECEIVSHLLDLTRQKAVAKNATISPLVEINPCDSGAAL